MTSRKPTPAEARAQVYRALAEVERVSAEARRNGIIGAAAAMIVLGGTAAATLGRVVASGRWNATIYGTNAQGQDVWFPDWPLWTVIVQLIAIVTLLALGEGTRRMKRDRAPPPRS